MTYSRSSFFFLAGFDPHHRQVGLTGRSLLSRRRALGVTGGVVTSGHCCQDKGSVPAPPRPCPLVSKLQPLALTVTLALTDTLNLSQPGNQRTHTQQGEVTVTCLLCAFLFAPIYTQIHRPTGHCTHGGNALLNSQELYWHWVPR